MNPWLLSATALLFALVPCGIATFRGSAIDRLVALEMASTIVVLILVLISEGLGNANFYVLGLAAASLAFGAGLVFARFLERYL